MAQTFLQVEDPSGAKCCDCAAQQGCSCGSICHLACRSTTGSTATFCGFDEFGAASNPPIYYQLSTLGGSSTMTCSTDGEGCTHPDQCTQVFAYSGSCSFDPNTCLQTGNGLLSITGSCSSTVIISQCDVSAALLGVLVGVECAIADVFHNNGGPNPTSVHTLTCATQGICTVSASGFTGCVCPTPNVICTLSAPDTIDQAINRAIGPNPVYTEANAGVCTSNSAFTTLWSTPSKTFGFRKAQYQVTIPGTTVGLTYAVKVILSERATGTLGPFTPFGINEISITATGGSASSPWIDIPLEGGLEIIPSSCTVTGVS